MRAQESFVADDPRQQDELNRRVATIEDLITRLLRTGVTIAIVAVILGWFDLWPALAGFGLVIAALTLAGQGIILDYLMGILILVEGQYFKGDTVRLGMVEGVVEEVGLRRTQVRDLRGTLHSISNGLIRESANLTRTYATATIDVDGVADRDVEAVIAVLDAVGLDLAADPSFEGVFHEPPSYAGDHPVHRRRRDAPPVRARPPRCPAACRGRDAPSRRRPARRPGHPPRRPADEHGDPPR